MKVISLFTGAGGLDLGLEAAGFENAVAVEMNPAALRTLHENSARWPRILDRSIHEYIKERAPLWKRASPILDAAGLGPREATLLAGGPPCQPFSKSGYWARGDSRRLDDPRAKTLDAYLDTLATALPEVFLLENVPGLSYANKNEGIVHLRERINRINRRQGVNYSFCVKQLNAAEYGVPQLRKRVFVIGHREGREFSFPLPTHALPPPVDMSKGQPELPDAWQVDHTLEPATTAWEAIGDLNIDDSADELQPRGRWKSVLRTIPEGANYLWYTTRGGGGIQFWGWRTRYWSMLLKLAKARPAWTITAQPGPSIGPFHWDSRRLAREELARLQTFPDNYKIVGTLREAQFQIGNAVPSALAEVLGLEIRRQLLDQTEISTKPSLIHKTSKPTPPPTPPEDPSHLPPGVLQHKGEYADHPGPRKGPIYQV